MGREHIVYSSTRTEKGYPLTTLVFLRPTRKSGSPLTPTDIAILQPFVDDYKIYFKNCKTYKVRDSSDARSWEIVTLGRDSSDARSWEVVTLGEM